MPRPEEFRPGVDLPPKLGQLQLMKSSFLWGALLLASAVLLSAEQTTKLLTILSTAEEETQMMALVLTNQAVQQGADVTILLCGQAGYLATDEGPSRSFAPIDRSPRDLLRALLRQGADVRICAIFLPNRDLHEDALAEGVSVARPPEITRLMLEPKTRLLSF